jgi:hypothetical protein
MSQLVVLLFLAASVVSGEIINTAVKREVAIKSLVIRSDIFVHFKRDDNAKDEVYTFILPESQHRDLSYISFFDIETFDDVPSRKLSVDSPGCVEKHSCWHLKVDPKKSSFGVKLANLQQLKPSPSEVQLKDPFQLKYETSKYYPSLYKTQKQKLKLR